MIEVKEKELNFVIEAISKIEKEISKHMVGQKELIRNVLICVLAGGNALLEGVPGLGKTRLVKTLGTVLGLDFSRIQFTPDLMPADVVGTNIITKSQDKEGQFTFQAGPVFSNIVLADEINRATPKTQSALLEAMQEKTVTVGNHTYNLPQPFFVLATQNPIEMEGTYPLPEAQLDRFMFKLNVPFPKLEELADIVLMTTGNEEEKLEKVSGDSEILKMRTIARDIPAARPVIEFVMKMVLATHPDNEYAPQTVKKHIRFGASPRGAQAILSGAKIRALLNERYNVSFEDVKNVSYSALRHRILLNFEGFSSGITVEEIIDDIINKLWKGSS